MQNVQKKHFSEYFVNRIIIFVLTALDVLAFERLLGPCMDVMKRNIGDYDEQLNKLGLNNRDLRKN